MRIPNPATVEQTPRMALPGLLLGGVLIGFSPIFVRLSEVGMVSTAFWRLALALAPLFLMSRQGGARVSARPRGWGDRLTLCLPGLFLATELVAWHMSLVYTSIANSTLLVNMAPVFVALISWIFLGKPLGRLFVVALAVTFSGVVVLKGGPEAMGGGNFKGDSLAILAALIYAGYILMVGRARERFTTPVIMLWNTSVAAIAILPLALLTEPALFPVTLTGWAVLCGLSWVSQAGGQSLIAWALAFLPATFSSLTLLLQPVVAAILAWALLGERLTWVQAIGGLIVLAGIWIARKAQQPATAAPR